ncbi:AMP-binding protein [Persicobacter psychrovividus]|uniref:Long-chain-fatty-acid--CoA ligase n=1 Tax=Persicobacter psychrovividus TaxID=387638 RepID=A0ABN6LBF4_9BACT|nr:long-chain-fatty-acid--CoA ligase [Persicobacter psychrovividus]
MENQHEAFFWQKNYPEGVPFDIDPGKYESLVDLFEETVEQHNSKVAFDNFDKELTYAELELYSRYFGAYLQQELGLKKGDAIAIQIPNLLQYPIALWGALRAGLVVVNTNPLYTPREMEHQFKDAGVKAILIYENFAYNLQTIVRNTDIETVIVTGTGDMLGTLKGFIVNLVVRHVKKMVPKYHLPDAVSFKEVLDIGKKKTLNTIKPAAEDIAFLQYTGGTTGLSKGAMLTHRNIIAALEGSTAWVKPVLPASGAIIVTALPMYHIFALTANCLLIFKLGGKNILITNPRDLPAFIKTISKHRFNMISGVNTLFNAMLNHPDFGMINFDELKVTLGGGMAVQDAVAQKWEEATGCPLAEAYGMTETSPGITINPLDGNHRMSSIGLPFPSTEVKIMSDEGVEVPHGEHGELWVRGPQVMKGYWKNEAATNEMFDGEWLKTGDIATVDDDGFFKIVDRKKEMILVSGFNVFPNEIENVIAMHPKVLEVGAIGIPDERSGEKVKVFVVKKDDSLTADEVIEFCKAQLTAYKVPKEVAFKAELPKTNVGKILRRKLKE